MGEGTPDYQIGSGFEPCLWSFGRSRRPFQTDQNRRNDRKDAKMWIWGYDFFDSCIFQGSVSAGVGFVGSSGQGEFGPNGLAYGLRQKTD